MPEKNVFTLKDGSPIFGTQPFVMPYPIESDKEQNGDDAYENWILQNFYYILGFYDQPLNYISFPWDVGRGNGTASYSERGGEGINNMPDWWWSPSSQMMLNYTYYMQIQPNLNSNHLVENVESTNRHAIWQRGGRIASILRKSAGLFEQKFKPVRFGADPLSPHAKSEKDKHIIREKILMLMKPAWDAYVKDMAKMPQQQKPFETPKEVEEWADTELKDFLADDYLNIALDNWKRQNWAIDIKQIYLDAKICDCTGIEHIFENGYYRKVVHMPYNLIVDNRYDDPFGFRRRFAGVIENLTLTEAYYKYPQLDDKMRKELYKLAVINNSTGVIDTPNISWWNYGSNYVAGSWGDMTITNVRVYWIAPEKIGKDEEIVQTVYTAELLGGMYLLNYGKADNIIENPNNPYVPMIPLQILTPEMKMGMFNSAVSRDRSFQDDYDVIRFKQMEMIGKADGIVAFLNASRLDGENSPVDVATDLKQYQFTYLNTSGQPNNPSDRQRMVETWDKRLDPGYQALSQKLADISAEIEMNLGATAISLGENNSYVGKDTYKSSSEASATGTYNFDEKVMTFIQINLDYGINLKKNLYANGYLKEEAESVVGQDGLWRLKKTKDRYTRDFGIYLELNDNMTEAQKQEMLKFLQPVMQNPNSGFTETDWINIYLSSTKTQIKDKVKLYENRIKEDREKAQESNNQLKLQQQQMAQEHEKAMMAYEEQSKQQKAVTLIKPKQEKLDFEREKVGLPPLHPEQPAQQGQEGQKPQQTDQQGQPEQQQPPQ